jgi:quercetin dioxygenase-like cupin family protein
MKIVNLEKLKPAPERASKFQGADFGADTSFFVVTSSPGRGVNKHRHPYEETMIILNGPVDITVGEETEKINSGRAIIIPAQTWHAFINKSEHNVLMVTIHASPKIIQENWKED